MDVASPYRDYYLAQVEELLDLYDVDGLWADITFLVPNYSAWSQAQMRKAGVNIPTAPQSWPIPLTAWRISTAT